jgi:hypothetical protein
MHFRLHHTYEIKIKWKNRFQSVWVLSPHICRFFSFCLLGSCNQIVSIILSKWLDPLQYVWVHFMISNHLFIWSNNDLTDLKILLIIAQLVPRFNASTLFFTLAMILDAQTIVCTSPSLSIRKCFLAIFTLSSHPQITYSFESTLSQNWNPFHQKYYSCLNICENIHLFPSLIWFNKLFEWDQSIGIT